MTKDFLIKFQPKNNQTQSDDGEPTLLMLFQDSSNCSWFHWLSVCRHWLVCLSHQAPEKVKVRWGRRRAVRCLASILRIIISGLSPKLGNCFHLSGMVSFMISMDSRLCFYQVPSLFGKNKSNHGIAIHCKELSVSQCSHGHSWVECCSYWQSWFKQDRHNI